jgi:hypothetical protein
MLKALIGKALKSVDDAGVETVLTLAFVAQFAVYALPLHSIDAVRDHLLSDERDVVTETGTVLQMPGSPGGPRATRAVVRESKSLARTAPTAAPKAPRPRRPDPVDDELAMEELDQARPPENVVRVTIIGPDGQPRTKIVRLSGSREGMAAPARRPHD